MKQLGYRHDNGGRFSAGHKALSGDCFCRAVAIAMNRDYQEVYDELNQFAKDHERPAARSRKRGGRSSARNGYHHTTGRAYMKSKGWTYHATMGIGTGCRVHLNADEIPTEGPVLCQVSKHYVAVIDGVVRDNHDPRRDGTRCVYGYFTPPSSSS